MHTLYKHRVRKEKKGKRTYGFAGLLHHDFVVRERHEDELLHSAFLLADHITVEGVLCNRSCITNLTQARKLKHSKMYF